MRLLVQQAAEQSARINKLAITADRILIALERDAENIRGLARIAELHHERLARVEGGGGAE